jgi:hypothetical protein
VLTDPDDPWRKALADRQHDVAVLVEPGQPTPSYVTGWPRAEIRLKGATLTAYLHEVRRRCNASC